MIVIALGSNLPGVWGTPKQALHRALDELIHHGIQIIETSRLYNTRPYGVTAQANFLNAVAIISTPIPAPAVLRVFKEIEAKAGRRHINTQLAPRFFQAPTGRRASQRWSPRPLDIDIVDYKGVIFNWDMRRPLVGRRLILPHAEAHKRAFVLRPLCDIAPFWHHPVLGATAVELLKQPAVRRAGAILNDAGSFF